MLRLLRGAAASAHRTAASPRITILSLRRNLSSRSRAAAASTPPTMGDDRPPFVVAVDGPAASGKGTLARALAKHFNLRYLDTGLIYRAVGADALRRGAALDDEAAVAAVARSLDLSSVARGDDAAALRTDAAAQAASRVSALPAVRAALLQAQRDFAAAADGGDGAVLDGRDIGTVVCPSAPAKLFVTASAEVRAGRRFSELQERWRRRRREGEEEEEPTLARVLEDLRARDARDAGRAASPLRAADDALVLDTSAMDADAAFEAARAYVEGRRRKNGR